MAEIKFCENNFSQGTEEVTAKLEKDEVAFDVEPCLGYCGDCAVGPFALLDDELIQTETPEELYNKIKESI